MAETSHGTQQLSCQGCDQEDKIVVFVGCTANGKSSLIRSILEYAGRRLEAKGVEVGMGSKSTTKTVSLYKTTVHIKDHYLKDTNGCIVDVDEDTDIYELEPVASKSQRHVHLSMLDTPGLDDSDNLKDEEARNGNASIAGSLQMRTVDEMHKFAVLKALAEAGKIHAICFVLSIENTLGDATQRILKEYLTLFQKSKLDKVYHFAHTYINVENMFGTKATNRPQVIEETFGIKKGTTKHHLIDNLPLHDDPISKHFADLALANFIKSLSCSPVQITDDVCYPKSDAHKSMDDDLIQSIDILDRRIKKEQLAFGHEIVQFKASKRPLEVRAEVEKTNWTELRTRFEELNTEELVEIGYQFKEEGAHLTSRTKLYFSLTAKAPIRDYKLFETNNCVWSGMRNIKKGIDKHCSATLEASWLDSASGSIILLGWKKEALATEVAHAEKEKDDAWSDYDKTRTEIKTLDTSIEEAMGNIALGTEGLDALKDLRGAIRTDHISLDNIKTHNRHFAVPDLCCYTVDQNELLFPQMILPHTNISLSSISEEYTQKATEISKALETATLTLKALELDFQRKERISQQLDSTRKTIIKQKIANDAKNADFQPWQPKSHLKNLSPRTRIEVLKPLSALQTELTTRLARTDDLVFAGLSSENDALKRRAETLQRGIEKLAILIKANKHISAKWNAVLLDLEAQLRAARDMVALEDREMLTIGAFTVLRKGIDEFGAGSRRPWEGLFDSWREVARCGQG